MADEGVERDEEGDGLEEEIVGVLAAALDLAQARDDVGVRDAGAEAVDEALDPVVRGAASEDVNLPAVGELIHRYS